MKRLSQIFFKSPLLRKQLLYVISICLFFTIISSIIQVYIQFQNDLKKIDHQFELIKSTHLKTISSSLWEMNTEVLKLHTDSILTMNHICYVEIKDNKISVVSGKKPLDKKTTSRKYPLIYNYYGKNFNIGSIEITASLSQVYSETLKNGILVSFLHSVEVFTVSFFILLFIYQFFFKNIIRISRYSKEISLDELESNSELLLNLNKRGGKDELDELAESLNNMRLRLKSQLDDKNFAQQKLRENEEFLRITLNSIIDGVITINLDGDVISINPMARELTGFNPETSPESHKKFEDIFDIYNLTTGLKIPDPFKTAIKFEGSRYFWNNPFKVSKGKRIYHFLYSSTDF